MSQPPAPSPAYMAIDEAAVALMGRTIGLDFPPERLTVIAQRLRDMHELAADLDAIDVTGAEPIARFDAAWPEETPR